jgi:hypothetical protein
VDLPTLDWTAIASPPGPNSPAWHPDPTVPGCLRYWDGRRWTGYTEPIPDGAVIAALPDPRPTVERRSLWTLAGLTVAGVAAVDVAFLATSTPCVQSGSHFDCDDMVLSSPALWLAWPLLVALAGAATRLAETAARGRRGSGPPLLWTGVLLAWAAVVFIFPPVMALGMVANAGL